MSEFFKFFQLFLAPFGLHAAHNDKKHQPRKRLLFGFCVLVSATICYLLWLDARLTISTPSAFIGIYISTIVSYIGHNLYVKTRCSEPDSNDIDLPGDLIVAGIVLFCAWVGISYGLTQAGAWTDVSGVMHYSGVLPPWARVYRVPETLEWVYGPTIVLFAGSTVFYRFLPLGNHNNGNHQPPEKHIQTC